MAQNNCAWIYKRNEVCSRRCVGEYCAAHNQQIKYNSKTKINCIKCGQQISGKTRLCAECGGKRYRSFADYYRRRYNTVYTEEDYISGEYKKMHLDK